MMAFNCISATPCPHGLPALTQPSPEITHSLSVLHSPAPACQGPYIISFPPCSLCCSHTSFPAVSQVHWAYSYLKAMLYRFLECFSPRSCLAFLQKFRSLSQIPSSSGGPLDSFTGRAPLLLCLHPSFPQSTVHNLQLLYSVVSVYFLFPPLECKVHKGLCRNKTPLYNHYDGY